jgi:hypothetical protein
MDVSVTFPNLRYQYFTSSGTFIATAKMGSSVLIIGWGGGGGGGGGGRGSSGASGGGAGGGGEGAPVSVKRYSITPGNYTVTIGAGGTGGAAGTSTAGGSGGNGGTTSFDTINFLGGNGGGPGVFGGSTGAGGAGGARFTSWGRGGAGGNAGQAGGSGTASPNFSGGSNGSGTPGGGGGGGGVQALKVPVQMVVQVLTPTPMQRMVPVQQLTPEQVEVAEAVVVAALSASMVTADKAETAALVAVSFSGLKCDMKNLDVYSILMKGLSLLLVVLMPIRHALIAALLLILADLCSGIWASFKEKRKITSHGLRRTVMKVIAYESAILVSFLLEQYLLDGVPLVKIISGFIGITEAKSFFENLKRITGIDFWSQIISKINLTDYKNEPPQ